jgi:hypothetical protein
MRVLKYGKRLGVILTAVLLGASLGVSSIATAAVVGSTGVGRPGFNPNGRGFNRGIPAFAGPMFMGPAINQAGAGQFPAQPNIPTGSSERAVINPSVVEPVVNEEVNVCDAGAEQALLLIDGKCIGANNGVN